MKRGRLFGPAHGAVPVSLGVSFALCLCTGDAAAKRDLSTTPIAESERWAIRAGSEDKVKALLADVGFMKELPGAYVWSGIEIDRSTIHYSMQRKSELPDGREVAGLLLSPAILGASGTPSNPGETAHRSRSFIIEKQVQDTAAHDPQITAALAAAVTSIIVHDDGSIYTDLGKPAPYAAREILGLSPFRPHALLIVLALASLLSLALRRGNQYRFEFKLTHLLPSLIQATLFAYWALYWPGLRQHLPLVLLQLVFAFAVEALLGLLLRRRAVLGFGPIPVVLSTNLFIQFPPETLYLSLFAIFTALATKALVRRGGRHVFNPSAIGISVLGCAHLLVPRLGDGDVSNELNLPPNMGELMLVLALIVQLRVPVVLISLSAAAALLSFIKLTGFQYFHPFWPPVLLVLLLVATDPATSPRTGLGRVFYGLCLGLLMATGATVLEENGLSDFYAKMIPVPVVNLLVPFFDLLGGRLATRFTGMRLPVASLFAQARNPLHVIGWFVLAVVGLGGSKSGAFLPKLHGFYGTPLIVRNAEGGIGCDENRIFCRPFSFLEEAALWARRDAPGAQKPPR